MTKLKERQFYNVSTRKREMVPIDYIEVVKFKNGAHALLGISKENVKLFKLFSEEKLIKMENKYGKSRNYRK
jgi:hypothetical protein